MHNALDVVADVTQGLLQHVLHDVGAQVTDVCVVVDGRAAGVHLDQIGIVGNEQFLLMGNRIIKIHIEFLQ